MRGVATVWLLLFASVTLGACWLGYTVRRDDGRWFQVRMVALMAAYLVYVFLFVADVAFCGPDWYECPV